MANLGNYVLMLALGLTIFGTIASLISALTARERLRVAAVRSLAGAGVLVLVAVACLAYLLQTDNFTIAYVQRHSNATLPRIFKLTAVWGGSEGSLLWWSLILSVYTWFFLYLTRKAPRLMTSWALVFIGVTMAFFLVINNVVTNPFAVWAQDMGPQGMVPITPPDGSGLNPQLQHWAMIIHPPLLYTGYIGFLFPFALTLGALITRMEGREWLGMIRRWTMTAWLILGVGIVLGGAWAYMELGWGGYWAWDPVENASFMPWLLATAFIHSIMAQERRGMFKMWNVFLLLSTFLMCLFGTGITRSGLISSVHAFAESTIGYYFFAFIIFLMACCVIVVILRWDQTKDDNTFVSVKSREVALLFNNVLFVAICLTMLIATIFPMLQEAIYGVKRELRHCFYNTVEIPIFLGLMLLMAVGPILTWKRTSDRLLRERFVWPTVAALLVLGLCLTYLETSLYAEISFCVLAFLFVTIVQEFLETILRRTRRAGENPFTALVSVVRLNKRRYGGYIVHLAVFLIAVGLTGAAFNEQGKEELGLGETMTVAGFNFQVADIGIRRENNFQSLHATINLMGADGVARVFKPEQRFYYASQSQASEVAIDVTPQRDYYVVLAGMGEGSTAEHPVAVFHVYVNPLVVWIWAGTLLMIFGSAIAMMPEGVRVAAAATVPVGTGEMA